MPGTRATVVPECGGQSRENAGADDRIRTGDLLITNPIQPRYAPLRPVAPIDAALLYQREKAEEIRCCRSHLAYAPL